MSEPITGTTDIDFLRSTTTTIVDRELDGDTTTTVEHLARFGVKPGSVPDELAEYSTAAFRPSWMEVLWRNGKLRRVTLTGPQRLKSGDVSEKRVRRAEWNAWSKGIDRARLPQPVRDAIVNYERAVAEARVSE